ncbi:MAG TPA: IPT/TIG domain-containing protein, partial [Thermoanaerobaculia bacterium]
FSGEDSAHGLELWKTNGNPAGTTLIKDVVVVSANSEPTAFTDLNGVMYFLANDGIHGKEIWRSDGTESGTFMVKEVFDGPDPGPYTLTSCGELLYTTGPDSDYGWELWRSDGTATGTFMLRDINTGTSGGFPLGSNPSRLTCVGNQLFFFAQVPADTPYASSVMSLWKTDGSSIGTILVKKFTTSSSADVVMAGLRSSAIFYLEGKLQISDGYTVTVLKDIGPGYRIVTTPNLAFFDGNNMLWRTDGTTAGTFTLPTAGYPVHMHPVGDKVFFFDSTGNSSTSAVRLTDGTAAGTIALQTNLWVGSRSGNESRVVGDSNSAFFFAAQTPSQFDTALWRSDGTPGAAAEVSSVRSPQLITDGDGVVFFAADWNRYFFRLDSAGATAIQGPAGALRVSEIGKSGTRVFAAAGELYAVDLAFATATISPATVTSSGGTTITIDGTGFDANTIVLVDGMQMPVNFVSASRLTFVAPAHVPGTARVEVRHLSGQVAKLTRGLMYVCDAIPTAVASGSAAFCPGGSTQLQGSGGVSCRWLPAAGLSDANSCSPTASPAVTTTYVLTVTSANGCASTNQASVTVQVHAVPDATITSPFSVDPNTNTTSSVADAGPGATYVWTIEQGEIVSGASSRTVTWRTSCATAGPVKLAVTVQTANGCTSSKEQLVSKRIIPSIAAISPTFGYTGTAVTLTGTRFTCVNSVTVGPHSVPFVATGDTTIQFTIPSLASAGQTLVAVRSPLGSDVRSFFSTAPPAKGDFTRDGWPDLLLRNPITGGNALWTMDGGTVTGVIDLVSFPNRNYRFAGTGDFTEDGLNDILLRNTLTGANAIWVMIGAAFNSVIDLPAIQNTQITFAATGDFNGDRKSDIVLRNYQTGANAVWLIERGKYVRTIDLPAIANSAIRFEGTGDFNGDDKTDIVLRNQTTGANAVWLMNGTALLAVVDLPALPNVDFRLAAVADLSKDGKPDLVWRNYATGQNAIWFMNGTSLAGVMDLPPLTNLDYEISGPR